jgi:hypothetical protein
MIARSISDHIPPGYLRSGISEQAVGARFRIQHNRRRSGERASRRQHKRSPADFTRECRKHEPQEAAALRQVESELRLGFTAGAPLCDDSVARTAMTGQASKRIRQLFWIIPLTFYVSTMSRSIGYVDAGLVLHNAFNLQISAWVNNHNLFSVLGWLWLRIFPLGSVFFRLNLLSALFGAGTVYVIFLCCWQYTRSLSASVIAASALMLSHSLWWHSTMLEVYTLNTLLIALILYSMLRYLGTARKRWYFAALFFWGLGVSNHMLMGLFAGAFLLFLILDRKNQSLRDLALGTAFLLLGLSLLIYAGTRSYLRYGSAAAVFRLLTGGEFRSLMFSPASGSFWRLNYLLLLLYQYPSLILVFLIYGLYALSVRPRRFELFLLAALLAQILWSANFRIWDVYAYALPVYVLSALPISKGLAARWCGRRLLVVAALSLLAPVLLYKNVRHIDPVRSWVNRYPMVERVQEAFDPVRYFLDPDKHAFDRVERYAGTLFRRLPEGAWYYDDTYDYPLVYYYQQVRRRRTDIHCPIVFPFWITGEEKLELATQINGRIEAAEPVFMAGFILDTLRPLLHMRDIERIRIDTREIYRLR